MMAKVNEPPCIMNNETSWIESDWFASWLLLARGESSPGGK